MHGVDFVKDTYIPIFTNKPGDYKEWRQRILLYKRKSDLNKKQKEATINLMTSLSGIAWKQIEGIAEKAAEAEDGFMMILTELGKTFKYDDQVEMPRAFERFFFGLHRREGQTMINYVADHREALAEVEKHGISIADKVAGWLLLRRAGLSTGQKQMVQGRASAFTQVSVVEALYTSCSAKTTKDVPVTIKAGNLVRAMVLPDGPATRTTWWRTPTRWMMKTGLMNLTMMHQPGNNGMMKPI
jgi:hypothetical protein